jgi:hypothetical protein
MRIIIKLKWINMYIKDIRKKLKQQRLHLVSTRNLLIKQLKLKDEITDLVRYSEEKLHQILQQENPSPSKINKLRENLADDQRLYAECKIFIHEFRADITATKKAIEKSNLKLHHIFFPPKTCGFFKQKNADDGQSSSFHQSADLTLQDKLFKGA